MYGISVLVFLLLGSADSKNHGDNVEGTWACVSQTLNGAVLQDKLLEKISLSLDDSTKGYALRIDNSTAKGKYSVDNGKKPGRLDLTVGTGKKIEVWRCIYKFHEGKLILCLPTGSRGTRPVVFEANSGSEQMVLIFRRKP